MGKKVGAGQVPFNQDEDIGFLLDQFFALMENDLRFEGVLDGNVTSQDVGEVFQIQPLLLLHLGVNGLHDGCLVELLWILLNMKDVSHLEVEIGSQYLIMNFQVELKERSQFLRVSKHGYEGADEGSVILMYAMSDQFLILETYSPLYYWYPVQESSQVYIFYCLFSQIIQDCDHLLGVQPVGSHTVLKLYHQFFFP